MTLWNCRNESTLHCPIFSRAHLLVVETRPAVLQCFFKDSRSSILRHEFRDISQGFIEKIDNSLSLINFIYVNQCCSCLNVQNYLIDRLLELAVNILLFIFQVSILEIGKSGHIKGETDFD